MDVQIGRTSTHILQSDLQCNPEAVNRPEAEGRRGRMRAHSFPHPLTPTGYQPPFTGQTGYGLSLPLIKHFRVCVETSRTTRAVQAGEKTSLVRDAHANSCSIIRFDLLPHLAKLVFVTGQPASWRIIQPTKVRHNAVGTSAAVSRACTLLDPTSFPARCRNAQTNLSNPRFFVCDFFSEVILSHGRTFFCFFTRLSE